MGPDSYHVKLTKVDDNSVSYSFLLAEGKAGEPRLKLGSREKEAAGAGQRGTIVIESLHHGSGQHIARDPMMYEIADGMFADEPGLIKTRGAHTSSNIAANQSFAVWSRGAYLRRYEDGAKGNVEVLVTPDKLYYGNGDPIIGPAAANRFTGSWAEIGGNVYFGVENATTRVSQYAAMWQANGAFSQNAGFKASFLASQGEKMWSVERAAVGGTGSAPIKLRWTDDTANATPIFSTDYTFETLRAPFVRDIGIIGPHAVVAVSERASLETLLLSLDSTGMFTPIMTVPMVVQFTPFLGGLLVWLAGRPRAVWLRDITSFQDLDLNVVGAPRSTNAHLPLTLPDAGQPGNLGFGAVAAGRELFVPIYGTFTRRDGVAINGTALVHAVLTGEGLFGHVIATPEGLTDLYKTHVLGAMVKRTKTPGVASSTRSLLMTTASYDDNTENVDVKKKEIDLWDGQIAPNAPDGFKKFLRTSRYSGPSRVTMKAEMLRGYVTQLPDNAAVTVRVYVDGSPNAIANYGITTTGPVSYTLPSQVMGRDIALDFETTSNEIIVVEMPWSVDYFAMPDQKDIVRLPVIAGRDQLTLAGTVTDETRAATLQALESMCESPERWTLEWRGEMPDWMVIPLGCDTVETEPDYSHSGAGAAIAWLNLQRL